MTESASKRSRRRVTVGAAAVTADPPASGGGRAVTPTGKRFDARRDAILVEAVRHFNARGLKGATLAGIAADVGLATNSITYYFRKKEDIATACLLRTLEVYTEMAQAAARESSVTARVTAFFRASGSMLASIDAGERPPIVQLYDVRALTGPHAEQVFTAYIALYRCMRTLLADHTTEGWTRKDLNARTHMLLSAGLWMRSWIRRYDRTEYALIGQRFADVVLNGIAVAPDKWIESGAESDWQLIDSTHGSSEAFLQAATAMVNEQGYRGASVERIAASINLTKGSFYHHHHTKNDLVMDCFARTFAVFRRTFDLAEVAGGNGWTRACMVARALSRFQLSEDGPLLRFSAFSALPGREDRDVVRMTMLRVVERMNSLLVAGMMDGSIRPHDPAIGAQVMVSMINAMVELKYWVPDASRDEIAELCGRPMVFGLLAPPTAKAG